MRTGLNSMPGVDDVVNMHPDQQTIPSKGSMLVRLPFCKSKKNILPFGGEESTGQGFGQTSEPLQDVLDNERNRSKESTSRGVILYILFPKLDNYEV